MGPKSLKDGRSPLLFVSVLLVPWLAGAGVDGKTVTVGSGTPASCTDAAMDAQLALFATGDVFTFNCGSAEHTINLESHKFFSKSGTIDGGGKITLDGQDKVRHFVFADADTKTEILADGLSWSLKNIKLVNGRGSGIKMGRKVGSTRDMNNPVYRYDGGAIYMGKRGELDMAGVEVVSCKTLGTPDTSDTEETNWKQYRGGAVYIGDTSTVRMTDCTFIANSCTQEGGAIHARWTTALLAMIRTTFVNNEAYDTGKNNGGGAIYAVEATVTCQYCLFHGNQAATGGAIRNVKSNLELYHCVFSQNTALYKPEEKVKPLKGGGVYVDGNLAETKTGKGQGHLIYDNVTFEENESQNGGGSYVCFYTGDTAVISNSKFCNNKVVSEAADVLPSGAGLQRDCAGNKLTITNVVMSGNTVTERRENGKPAVGETFADSRVADSAIILGSDIPGIAAKNGQIQEPPGTYACPVTFCEDYPQYCGLERPAGAGADCVRLSAVWALLPLLLVTAALSL